MKNSIVIVDDHILIAKAIAGVIEKFEDYRVLYEVEHGKALMEKFKSPRNIPDIVLLDITMPVMDGFDTATWIKANHPEVLILALSMQNDDLSLIKMIKAGAKGYLLKNIQPVELNRALDELTTRGHYYPEWAASKIFSSISEEKSTRAAGITFNDRELEFLKYCCSEMTYKEIGEKMNCATRTVESYRDSLFNKLGLKTRVGLAIYALKTGKGEVYK